MFWYCVRVLNNRFVKFTCVNLAACKNDRANGVTRSAARGCIGFYFQIIRAVGWRPRKDHEVWRDNLISLEIDPLDPTIVIASTAIPFDIGSFTIHEVGLYDVDGDLIVIANYPPTYKNVVAEGAISEYLIRLEMKINNTDLLNLSVDPSVILATKEYVDIITDSIKISTYDEGVLVTNFTKSYNFTGEGVSASGDGNGNVTVDISGLGKTREDKLGNQGIDQGNGYYRFTLSNQYRVGANNDLVVFRGNILHRGPYDFESASESKDYVEVGSFGQLSNQVDIKGLSAPNNNLAFFVAKSQEEGVEPSEFMFAREFQLGSQGTLVGGKYRYVTSNSYTVGSESLFVFKGGMLLKSGTGNDYDEAGTNAVDLIDQVLPNNHLQFVMFDPTKFQREYFVGSDEVPNPPNYRFTLTSTSYNTGSGDLFVFKGGQLLRVGFDYDEIDSVNFELYLQLEQDKLIVKINKFNNKQTKATKTLKTRCSAECLRRF